MSAKKRIRTTTPAFFAVALCAACSGNDDEQTQGGALYTNTGGVSAASGGAVGAGGTPLTSGTGGIVGNGGTVGNGGAVASGGAPNTGGVLGTGGELGGGGQSAGGNVGSGGDVATGGTPSAGGAPGTGGTLGTGGAPGTGGSPSTGGSPGTGGGPGGGKCCTSGNCLCHGPDPKELTSARGPFTTATFRISTGTVNYPTNADPPFAGVAICGGYTNTGPEMAPWGTFYASHGIVTVITTTGASDSPDQRATKLVAAIEELKKENTKSGSPLFNKLSDRFGTSGYSMGGGGTTIASGRAPTMKTSVGLAAWGPRGAGIQVPTLLLCGLSDTTAPCSTSQGAYDAIPGSTQKMMVSIPGATHFSWFGPTNAGGGTSGKYALAFQKVFLEGDERWRPLLLQKPSGGTQTTNIK